MKNDFLEMMTKCDTASKEIETLFSQTNIEVFEPDTDTYKYDHDFFTIRPLKDVDEFKGYLRGVMLITNLSNIKHTLIRTNDWESRYIFALVNKYGDLMGFLVTDMFFENKEWCLTSLYRQGGIATGLKALVYSTLQEWRESVALLKEFME